MKKKSLFNDPVAIEAIVLAQLGRSNKSIALACPTLVSHGAKNRYNRINYRLHYAAKRVFDLPKGEGFRTQWREGTSEISQIVARQTIQQLRKETKSRLQ